MSYSIPYSFIPGTKARAQEVNANFQYVLSTAEELNSSKLNTSLSNVTQDGLDAIKNSIPYRNVGEIVKSTLPFTDSSFHLLDGSLIQGEGTYADFVNHIASLYGDGTNTPTYFTDETTWQASVSAYGVCGKFVYDSTNNTVRLPKTSSNNRFLIDSYSSGTSWYRVYSDGWCEQGGKTAATTDGVSVSLLKTFVDTNYTVFLSQEGGAYATTGYGATKTSSSKFAVYNNQPSTGSTRYCYWIAYGYCNISSYKPIQIYEYIVIATSTNTDIQVDIDNIATDLNGKMETDLSNMNTVSQSAKNTITNWGMPNYTSAITLTGYGTSNSTFTVPSDGIINVILYGHNVLTYFYIDDVLAAAFVTNFSQQNGYGLGTMFVTKGSHTFRCSASANVYSVKFYPLKGAN